MPVIRTATPGDAAPLSRLAEATFRGTFGAANTSENMDRHCCTSYGEAIQSGEIADPRMLTLLCDGNEGLVGFAQLRWDGAPDCVAAASPGQIQRLYVADAWHGKGIAQNLMRACIREMEARGSDVIWLGVWEHNPRAIAFYRKCGFVEVGDHVFPLGNDPQRDIVMARSIAGSSSNIGPRRRTSGGRP
ncbi:GCN5 family acetyltransferase [Rhodanobacter thiooxydans]|uniref:GCN5 family acetyltransferase n=1 Tax=Rhodanobacter thiooxydans TaxID=416169 RepID=A0A154QJB4_9GAMM|nr:GNAT family N-acetyltransferase [Rhodanobacter thiooxydans]KZC24258.1 GCN5 family acetyltransferase [Rhodanobacter thiooxydans]MCW0203510.1 GNAT family N-acetyltransferase [Rhodanobacter thiooxydans]